jgi:hypothetical protein
MQLPLMAPLFACKMQGKRVLAELPPVGLSSARLLLAGQQARKQVKGSSQSVQRKSFYCPFPVTCLLRPTFLSESFEY